MDAKIKTLLAGRDLEELKHGLHFTATGRAVPMYVNRVITSYLILVKDTFCQLSLIVHVNYLLPAASDIYGNYLCIYEVHHFVGHARHAKNKYFAFMQKPETYPLPYNITH